MTFRKAALGAVLAALAFLGCQLEETRCDAECQDAWLDGIAVDDECLDTAKIKCLVSQRLPRPDSAEKESLGIVIAVHGYTASTFEWKGFAGFADTTSDFPSVRVSRVLLGGHGRDLDDFQSSTWKGWGAPILAEYDSLVARGYKRISFACASTGCALLMEQIAGGAFAKRPAPAWVYMIDPIVVPTAKILSLADLIGPIVGNVPDKGTVQENMHWYVNRPQETLVQLYGLINLVKNRLEDGIRLPRGTRAVVRKSKRDNNADPVGALIIYNGLREADGAHVDVRLVDSRLHVFTRLEARSQKLTKADTTLRDATFLDMARKAAGK